MSSHMGRTIVCICAYSCGLGGHDGYKHEDFKGAECESDNQGDRIETLIDGYLFLRGTSEPLFTRFNIPKRLLRCPLGLLGHHKEGYFIHNFHDGMLANCIQTALISSLGVENQRSVMTSGDMPPANFP